MSDVDPQRDREANYSRRDLYLVSTGPAREYRLARLVRSPAHAELCVIVVGAPDFRKQVVKVRVGCRNIIYKGVGEEPVSMLVGWDDDVVGAGPAGSRSGVDWAGGDCGFWFWRSEHRLPIRRKGALIQRDKVLLVRDTAGLVDSLGGEGLYHAIRSAQVAAGVLADHLEGPQGNESGRYEASEYSG